MKLDRIGIAGAGTMGAGIAQVVAQAGFELLLLDLSDVLVKGAVEKIERGLAKNVEKGKLSTQEMGETLKRIHPTTRAEDFRNVNMVIEAVFEEMTFKVELLQKLSGLCPSQTVFASNTSTLSITRLATAVSSPERFVGLHFFNPVPLMRLVEVIPGLQTSGETVNTCTDFAKRIKKTPIHALDCPGFLVNRIFMPYAGEAMLAAQEGAAQPEAIDESIKQNGFPIGPLTLNDMVGIDVGVHGFPILYEAYGIRFPVPLLFERLFQAGRLGVKSGKGIYADKKVDDEFFEIVKRIQEETGIRNTEFSAERLILRQVNEAIYCLQEKIATADHIDRAMVLGTGFPCDEKGVGGPLHWADDKGLDWVLDKLTYFRDTLGPRFWPHPLLKQYVAAGYLGKKVKKGFFDY
jgi:3-hydroxyacyl-CoA dehydrogenase